MLNLNLTAVKPILPDAPLWQLVSFSDGTVLYCENGSIIRFGHKQVSTIPWGIGRTTKWRNKMAKAIAPVMALSWFFILQHRILVQQFDSSNKLTSSHFSYIEHQITGFSTEQACDQAMAQMVPNTTLRSNLLVVVPCVEKQ